MAQHPWDTVLDALDGDAALHLPSQKLLAFVAKTSTRRALTNMAREQGLHTVGDLLDEAGYLLAGRPMRNLRADLDVAVGRFLTSLEDRPAPTGRRGSEETRPLFPGLGRDPDGRANGPTKRDHRAALGAATAARPFAGHMLLADAAESFRGASMVVHQTVERAVELARTVGLLDADHALIASALDTLAQPMELDPMPPVEDVELAEVDRQLEQLQLEVERGGLAYVPAAQGQIGLRTRGRPSISVSWLRPHDAPRVVFPLPRRGPIERAEVERRSQIAEPDRVWTEMVIATGCRLIRSQLRDNPELAQEILEARRVVPWASAFERVPEAAEPEPEAELWWSIDPDNLGFVQAMLRQRTKRGNGWRKLRSLQRKDLARPLFDAGDRAVATSWLSRDRRYSAYSSEGELAAREVLFGHLVGHPRVCQAADPEDRIEVRGDRLRPELAMHGDRGRLRLVYGDGTPLTREDLHRERLLQLAHGFAVFESDTLWVVQASDELVRSVHALEDELELDPDEIPEALEWMLEHEAQLEGTVRSGRPLGEDELEVVIELEHRGASVDAQLMLTAPGIGASSFGPTTPGRFVLGKDGSATSVRTRDPEVERRFLRAWLDVEPGAAWPWSEDGGSASLAVDEALELLGRLQGREDVEVRWRSKRSLGLVAGSAGPSDLRIQVKDGLRSYLMTGALRLGAHEVALGDLLEAIHRGSGYVAVDGDTYAAIDATLRASLAGVGAVATEAKDGARSIPTAAAHRLLELEQLGPRLEGPEGLEALRERAARARALRPAVPEGFSGELRPYQLEGLAWALRLAELGLGACLADDMGLGKTVQALAVMAARADAGPALVVAPTSVMFNWLRDGERFTPGLDIRSYHGQGRSLDDHGPGVVFVTSYGVVLRDHEALAEVPWATLVYDEAQAMKTASSKTAKVARSLGADFVLALTGTPVENHAGELWSVFEVLAPGLLGTQRSFAERYGAIRNPDEDRARRARLAHAVRPLVLRRTKAQVLTELPPKTEVRVDVVLSKAEQRLYDGVRAKALAELHRAREEGASGGARLQALAILTRLRQLACHPRLIDPESTVTSSKHARLHELLSELVEEDRQVLVFSQFVRQLDLVAAALKERGIGYERLVGETSVGARLAAVDRFSQGSAPVFLVSLKAGGVGLNLTAADTVIFLDPWWNPAAEAQAADRTHRIGQDKPVTVYRLVARGTLEDTVLDLQAEKRKLVEDVLSGTDQAASLDVDGIIALLGEPGASDP